MELLNYKSTLSYKHYKIYTTYCSNGECIIICDTNNNYEAYFSRMIFTIYPKCGKFAYEMKDLTDSIPNVMEDTPSGGWLFEGGVDLSNVIDELIGIYEHWLHLNSLMIEYLKKSSCVKSARSA